MGETYGEYRIRTVFYFLEKSLIKGEECKKNVKEWMLSNNICNFPLILECSAYFLSASYTDAKEQDHSPPL